MENAQGQTTPTPSSEPTATTPATPELEKLRAELAEANANRDRLYARAKTAETLLAERQGTAPSTPPNPQTPPSAPDTYSKAEVNLLLRGYSEEELDLVRSLARGKGVGIDEAAKDAYVVAAIDSIRTKRKSTEATPPPSRRGPPSITPETVKDAGKAAKKTFAEFSAERRSRGKSNE